MSVVNFTTEDGKTYKKIVRLTGFNIGGTEYQCTTALRMRGATIETPIYSSASMRVIIRAAFPSGASGYLFGDSRFNIKVDGNSLVFLHDGTISTTKNIEFNRVYEFGFINGIPFFQGNLEEAASTSTTGSEKCLIGGAVGKTTITDFILYRIDVYGHYDTTSDKKEAYAYYPCKQGNTAYMVEKWSNSLVTITGTASIYDPNEEEVVYGIGLNEVSSIIGSAYHDLMAIMIEDHSPDNAYPNEDYISDEKGNSIQSAFALSDINTITPKGTLMQSRRPRWNIWADGINIGKKIIGTTTERDVDVIHGIDSDINESVAIDAKGFQDGYLTINPIHEDGGWHLEDFENYCHATYHKPVALFDGNEMDDWRILDEGWNVYPQLKTAYYCNYPIGGTGIDKRQKISPDGYPLFKLRPGSPAWNSIYESVSDIDKENDEFFFKDVYYEKTHGDDKLFGCCYKYRETSGNPIITEATYYTGYNKEKMGVVGIDDLEPSYKMEQGGEVETQHVVNEPIVTTSRTVRTKRSNINEGTGHAETFPVRVNILPYTPVSGIDVAYKFGNLINWHLEESYPPKNDKSFNGVYFALRLTTIIGTGEGNEHENRYGVPLMLGYKTTSTVLGSKVPEEEKNEILNGIKAEDVLSYLPNVIRSNFAEWNQYGGNFYAYADMGLLYNGFALDSEHLLDFSKHVISARRLFRQNYVDLRYGIYHDTNIIINGLDSEYTINGETYQIRMIGRQEIGSDYSVIKEDYVNAMMLHQNKSVTLFLGVFKKGTATLVEGFAAKAQMTIYREVRHYSENSTWNVESVDYFKSATIEKTALSFGTNNNVTGFVGKYGGLSPADMYNRYDGSLGKLRIISKEGPTGLIPQNSNDSYANLFDTGVNDGIKYNIALTWTAKEDFVNDTNIVRPTQQLNNPEYDEDLYVQYTKEEPYIFRNNCTFVIEVTGIVSK